MTKQVAVVLDADSTIPDSLLREVIDVDCTVVRLSQFGAPEIQHHSGTRGPVDWLGLSSAMRRLVSQAKRVENEIEGETSFHVIGQAPLPLFVQLGNELSAWTRSITIHNRRKDGVWDSLDLTGECPDGSLYFAPPTGLDGPASEADGLVAVFASTGFPAPRDELRRLATNVGNRLAGVVELLAQDNTLLTASNAPAASREFEQALSRIPLAYPSNTGVIIAVAGPATLALMAGRAFNPKVIQRAVVPSFAAPHYEAAIELPSRGQGPIRISTDQRHVELRKKTLQSLLLHIRESTARLTLEDLPSYFPREYHQSYLDCVQHLDIPGTSDADGFSLSVLSRELQLGAGLLEVLGGCDDTTLELLGPIFVLHEVYHATQRIQSTNFPGIGRAGYCLEELDFWADSFAIETLVNAHLRTNPEVRDDPARVGELLRQHVDAVLEGARAFDRSEQGERLRALPERRLRRYLLWALKRASVPGSLDADKVSEMLHHRPQVELAPLRVGLDERYEKTVLDVPDHAELFVVANRRLVRMPASQTFSPQRMVEAVRSLQFESLFPELSVAVHEHPGVLAPWVARI